MGFHPSPAPSPFFTGSLRIVFLAIASRIVPPESPGVPGAGTDATVEAAETFLESQEASVRKRFALLLEVLEWGAVFRFGRRFSRLPAEKQDAYLRCWESSRFQLFRFGFSALRNLVFLAFYTRPAAWQQIGYPGPVLEAKAVER